MALDLTQTGTNVSGSGVFTVASGSNAPDCEPVGTSMTYPIASGSIDGANLTLTFHSEADHVFTLAGTQSGSTLSGTAQDQEHGQTRNGTWNAARQ
jgi:hypothetical protein